MREISDFDGPDVEWTWAFDDAVIWVDVDSDRRVTRATYAYFPVFEQWLERVAGRQGISYSVTARFITVP